MDDEYHYDYGHGQNLTPGKETMGMDKNGVAKSVSPSTPASKRSTTSNLRDPFSVNGKYNDDEDEPFTPPLPPYLSSPSIASPLAPFPTVTPPSRHRLSRSSTRDERDTVSSSSSKLALARRLSNLAQQLTNDEEVDEQALASQLDEIERAVSRPGSRQQRLGSLDVRSPSEMGGSVLSSPPSSLSRHYFPSLSASPLPEEEEPDPAPTPEKGRDEATETARQPSNKIMAEITKLNEELAIVVENLRARQEESDHIHELLIERAERAAQRIIFLQSRIAYLEQELRDNDEEVQHLRICLKAVEVQMPTHPDPDIQRCITTFKNDYQALKKRRGNRNGFMAYFDPGSTARANNNASHNNDDDDDGTEVTASPAR